MVRKFVSLAVVLVSSAATAMAQDGIKSPRDAATGQVVVQIEASNTTSTAHWIEIESVTFTVRDAASGQSTGKRQYSPLRVRTPLPPGGPAKSWSLGETQSGTIVAERGALVIANIDGARCTYRAALRREGSSNRFVIEIDGVDAGWFKSDGKLDPARCSAS